MAKKRSTKPISSPSPALFLRVDEVLKLEAGGKIADAVKAARSLAVENPDRAEIARLAIDMALRGNKEQAAETVVKALRSKHADSLAAGYVTAYVHLRRGRLEAARKAVDKLSARFPTSTFAALLFADICAAQSDYENAIAKLEAVVSRHGGDGPLHHRLAGLYWRSARLEEAAEAAQQARDLGMTQTANARLLGAALCQLERYGEAVPILHEADESEPGHFDTMALLSVARCGAGDSAGATVDVERALDLKPFSVRAPTGLDDGSGLTVLVPEFASAAFFMRADFAQYQEHNFIAYLTAPDLRVVHAPVTAGTAKRLARSGLRPDIIVNNLTVKELVHDETQEHYQTVIDNFDGVPVVNPIDRVLECGREENYRKFESETDFIFPKTRPLSADAKTLDAVVEEIETHFTWPVLLRPTHTNIGEGMDLIDGPDGLRDRMNLIGRKDHFVIQYHECRNEDGVGRQYRASIVDGEFLGDKANTHVDYQSHNDFRQEAVWFEQGYDKPERAYLADPSGALGFDVYERFASLFAKTPLDIYGIDFAINREGRPVVFEANAAMNLYDLKNVRWTPYHKEYHDNFQRTVARYLRGRAA